MSGSECCGLSAGDCEAAGESTVEVVDLSGLCDETGRFILAPPVGTYVWVVKDEFDGMDGFVDRWKVPY